MPRIEVIYEDGVFRPLRPIDSVDLPEGTRLQVKMIKIADDAPLREELPEEQQEYQEEQDEDDEAAYDAFLQQLDGIAALPLESPAQPQTARDHDAILYPRRGIMP